MQITTFFFGAPVWAGLQRLFFEKSMSGIPVWGRSPETLILFNFPKGLWKFYVFSLIEKDFEVFILFLSGICLKNTLNINFSDFLVWNPCLKRLLFELFWFFSVWNPCLKILELFVFSLPGIPLWKDFELFWFFSVWNPCLKRLWIFLLFPVWKDFEF